MKEILNYTLVLVLLLFMSCSNERLAKDIENEEKSEISNKTVVIDIKQITQAQANLSQLIKDVDYIVLSSDGVHLLSVPSNIKVADSLIYVSDLDEHLFCLNSMGKFIRDAAIKGHSQNEIVRLYDFEVDKNYLYLLDGTKSAILKFKHDGSFVSSTRLQFRAIRMAKMGNDKWSFQLAPFTSDRQNEDCSLAITDGNYHILHKYFKRHSDEKVFSRTPFFENTSSAPYFFAPMNRRSIYEFKKDGKPFMAYYLNFNQPYFNPDTETDGYSEAAKEQIFYTDQNPVSDGRYLIQAFYTSKDVQGTLIVNMKNKKTVFFRDIYNDRHDVVNFSFLNTKCYNKSNQRFYAFSDVYDDKIHTQKEISQATSNLNDKYRQILVRHMDKRPINGVILTYKLN